MGPAARRLAQMAATCAGTRAAATRARACCVAAVGGGSWADACTAGWPDLATWRAARAVVGVPVVFHDVVAACFGGDALASSRPDLERGMADGAGPGARGRWVRDAGADLAGQRAPDALVRLGASRAAVGRGCCFGWLAAADPGCGGRCGSLRAISGGQRGSGQWWWIAVDGMQCRWSERRWWPRVWWRLSSSRSRSGTSVGACSAVAVDSY